MFGSGVDAEIFFIYNFKEIQSTIYLRQSITKYLQSE